MEVMTQSKNSITKLNLVFKNNNNGITDEIRKYLNTWALKQQNKEYFSVILNTLPVTEIDYIIGANNAVICANFIKKMKKQPQQYLKYTIFVNSNPIIIGLLNMMFKITKPCADFYIVKTNEQGKQLDTLLSKNNSLELSAYLIINEIKYIKPGK